MSNSIALSPEQFIFAQGEELITTSLKVAEAFGKRHDNILRTIANIIPQVSDSFCKLNFEETVYERKNPSEGKAIKSKMYNLTKDGFLILVMGFTGKPAMAIKEAYINAFNLMHNKLFPKTQYGLKQLPPLTPKQQRHIQQRVKELVNTQVSVTYTSLWGGIKKQFDVGTYKDIPEVKYPELCQFLKCEPLQGELLPKETSPVTEAQTIQHLRDNGYLVAKANRHDLKKMTRDYIPLSLFNELIEVVNERMKETNHEGVFIKKSVLSGITKTVHCFGVICEGAMRDIEKVEEETGLKLYNRF